MVLLTWSYYIYIRWWLRCMNIYHFSFSLTFFQTLSLRSQLFWRKTKFLTFTCPQLPTTGQATQVPHWAAPRTATLGRLRAHCHGWQPGWAVQGFGNDGGSWGLCCHPGALLHWHTRHCKDTFAFFLFFWENSYSGWNIFSHQLFPHFLFTWRNFSFSTNKGSEKGT